MRGLSLLRNCILAVLMLTLGEVSAQQGQTLRIVKGKKVTLRADTEHALSYIWFLDGETINGVHDNRIVVTENGKYTVIALGDGCNSDLSDPIEIIVDPLGEEVQVDLEIRNLPDRNRAMVSQEFNFQLMVLNNSISAVDEVTVTFSLPQQLKYLGVAHGDRADVIYHAATHELIWQLPRLEAKEAVSQWIRVRGSFSGQAITTARVTSKQDDIDLSNNIAQAAVDIITIFIPNVITPNGDGKNDTFKIIGLDLFKSNKLLIFNRFGNEMYSAKDYQNNWSGEGLNEGTYFYYLEIEDWSGTVHRQKGYILLVRAMSHQ